eukprot:SAG22_NODE_837_length_6911_cov_4.576629_4_plen_85_part_00
MAGGTSLRVRHRSPRPRPRRGQTTNNFTWNVQLDMYVYEYLGTFIIIMRKIEPMLELARLQPEAQGYSRRHDIFRIEATNVALV